MMRSTILIIFMLTAAGAYAQKNFTLSSPDGRVRAGIEVGNAVTYNVSLDGELLLDDSAVSMTLGDGRQLGVNAKLANAKTRSADESFSAHVYKRNLVRDSYNELTLTFRGGYGIVFRAYGDGVAYRFFTTFDKPYTVAAEQAEFNFPADNTVLVSYVRKKPTFEGQFFNSFENTYSHIRLSEWEPSRLAFLPVVVEGPNGKKVCLTEADLLDYPGMYLIGEGQTSLRGVFAPLPETMEQGGHNMLQMPVTSRKAHLAEFDGPRKFPWRTVITTSDDTQLADNDMVYRLGTPPQGDFSWVRPGKVAWDWWNAWNLYGVDFETGVNNETYKYYIDFASRGGIEYVILDEGWAVNKKADLMQVVPEIDLEMLAAHAAERNVGLILWAGYLAFDRDMENVCRHYSQMGIKGFKIDFMDRDDQIMVDFHRRAAETAARYGLMVDFHGTYKPTGLHRTYPNVVNFEGVHGLEQMKWSAVGVDQVTYDVTAPFVRQVAGPMDYTQGAMRNASKENYRPVYTEAMSQGTRCRQLAEYVVFESPLNMLCDSPSNYMGEPECFGFIARIPTVWDETVAVNGRIAEYVTIARRSGGEWYVGSLTGWDAREMTLDLSFLGSGDYRAEIFADGVNAHRAARDYVRTEEDVPADRMLNIRMAPGGGFAARIFKASR